MAIPITPILTSLAPVLVERLVEKSKLSHDVGQKLIKAVHVLDDGDKHILGETIITHLNQSDQQQMQLNKLDAVSARFWQAGWRPFIGWVCGMAFCWHFLVGPIIETIATAIGLNVPWPRFEMETLNTTLFGLLGLGAMRTFEKVRGAPAIK